MFTRVHRETGLIGLLVGLSYGMSAILADFNGWDLPLCYMNMWWAYLWNIILPVTSIFVASKVIDLKHDPASDEELRGLIYQRRENSAELREWMGRRGICARGCGSGRI